MPLKTSISEELPSVNLTSMIDVVFLLIIFFMVGTKFTDLDRQISVKLPGAGALQPMVAPPNRRQINVTKDGSIYFEKQPLTPEQLTERLRAIRAEYPGVGVVVNGDRDATHGRMALVLGAVQRAEIKDLSIGVGINQQLR
jgi:biopolymer transport protein ExbD